MNLTCIFDLDGRKRDGKCVPCIAEKAISYFFDEQDKEDRVLAWDSSMLGFSPDLNPEVKPSPKKLKQLAAALRIADKVCRRGVRKGGADGRCVVLSATHWPPGIAKEKVLRYLIDVLKEFHSKECPDHPAVFVGHGDEDQPHAYCFIAAHAPSTGILYHPGPHRLSILQKFEWTRLVKPGKGKSGHEIAKADGVTLNSPNWRETKLENKSLALEKKDSLLAKLYEILAKKDVKSMLEGGEIEFRVRQKDKEIISFSVPFRDKEGKIKVENWRLKTLVKAPIDFLPDLLLRLGLEEWAKMAQKIKEARERQSKKDDIDHHGNPSPL